MHKFNLYHLNVVRIMRKFLLLLLVICSINAVAQKRIKSFSAPINYSDFPVNLTGTIDYNDEGNPSVFSLGMSINYMGYEQNIPIFTTTYSYGEDSLSQSTDLSSMGEGTLITSSSLSNGKAKTITYNIDDKSYSYDFDYENDHLVSIAGDDEDGIDVNADLVWDNGNLINYYSIVNGDSSTKITFDYSDVPSDPVLNSILALFIENQLTANAYAGLTPVKYFGLTCKNLPSRLSGVIYSKDEDTGEQTIDKDTIDFVYTVGNDGFVNKVTAKGIDLDLDEETTVHDMDINITWEDVPATGVSSIKSSSKAVGKDEYYSIEGRVLPSPRKGLNIIHHADGTVQKVILK